MLVERPAGVPPSEPAPEGVYLDRWRVLGAVAGIGLAAAGGALAPLLGCEGRGKRRGARRVPGPGGRGAAC